MHHRTKSKCNEQYEHRRPHPLVVAFIKCIFIANVVEISTKTINETYVLSFRHYFELVQYFHTHCNISELFFFSTSYIHTVMVAFIWYLVHFVAIGQYAIVCNCFEMVQTIYGFSCVVIFMRSNPNGQEQHPITSYKLSLIFIFSVKSFQSDILRSTRVSAVALTFRLKSIMHNRYFMNSRRFNAATILIAIENTTVTLHFYGTLNTFKMG